MTSTLTYCSNPPSVPMPPPVSAHNPTPPMPPATTPSDNTAQPQSGQNVDDSGSPVRSAAIDQTSANENADSTAATVNRTSTNENAEPAASVATSFNLPAPAPDTATVLGNTGESSADTEERGAGAQAKTTRSSSRWKPSTAKSPRCVPPHSFFPHPAHYVQWSG